MPIACFTGHRQVNDAYYNHDNPTKEWAALKNRLESVIQDFITKLSVNHFVSGMAIGVDSVAVEAVALVRAFHGPAVSLTAAIPFPSQSSNWPASTQARWVELCGLCNRIVTTSDDPYTPQKMQIRNEWMVNLSNYVIAVWDGIERGGTWNCIQYALSTGKPVFHIYPITLGTVWRQS